MLKELLQASEASPEHRKLGGLFERVKYLLTSNGLLEILLSRINDRISLCPTTDQPQLISLLDWFKLRCEVSSQSKLIVDRNLRLQAMLDRRREGVTVITQTLQILSSPDSTVLSKEQHDLSEAFLKRDNNDLLKVITDCYQKLKEKLSANQSEVVRLSNTLAQEINGYRLKLL